MDQETFKKAVEPAIKWLNENVNPHHSIEITPTTAELKCGEMIHKTEEFLRD